MKKEKDEEKRAEEEVKIALIEEQDEKEFWKLKSSPMKSEHDYMRNSTMALK